MSKKLNAHFSNSIVTKINDVLTEELSSSDVVEVRQDPQVDTTWAIRVKNGSCALVQVYNDNVECLDTFELEDGQKSLKDIKSGGLRFI